jgi:hypothetical protein
MVDDKFTKCGHSIKRRCWEDIGQLSCQTKVSFIHEKCGHSAKKKCYVDPSKLVCKDRCQSKMNCQQHSCPEECGPPHSHSNCQIPVKFSIPVCGHEGTKKCHESVFGRRCDQDIRVVLKKCRHEVIKKCHQSENDVICGHLCRDKNDCQKHECERKCGEDHSHALCNKMVDYSFPNCRHPSPIQKKCSEPISWNCKAITYILHPTCRHQVSKECWQQPGNVVCSHPCNKVRDCSHPCTNICGQDCNTGNCKICKVALQKQVESFKLKAFQRINELTRRHQTDASLSTFQRTELHKTGPTASEYMDIGDKVLKYIQPMHNWFPTIEKIERVFNLELEKKFEEAKTEAFGMHVGEKFHGTGAEGVKNIPKKGFRLPGPPKQGQRPGMFGQGIYFATDSSKSAQEIYTKGSFRLLLCDVLIGNSKTVTKADSSLCLEKLRREEFDSVYAIRNSKDTGGVENDEYVVFDPRQAIVRYIIHYKMGNLSDTSHAMHLAKLSATLAEDSFVKNVKVTREFNMDDPLEFNCKSAESHFLQMLKRSGGPITEIESIDIVFNKKLQEAFDRKKLKFKKEKIPEKEVYAFHGTARQNVANILKENLQLSFARRQAHGPGNYFSEFPDTSMGYGDSLILFRVLPGKEFCGSSVKPPDFNSKKVGGNAEGFGDMLIIEDSSQFVPFAVYHLKKRSF